MFDVKRALSPSLFFSFLMFGNKSLKIAVVFKVFNNTACPRGKFFDALSLWHGPLISVVCLIFIPRNLK